MPLNIRFSDAEARDLFVLINKTVHEKDSFELDVDDFPIPKVGVDLPALISRVIRRNYRIWKKSAKTIDEAIARSDNPDDYINDPVSIRDILDTAQQRFSIFDPDLLDPPPRTPGV